MLGKMKDKIPGEKKSEKYSKPMPGVEIEIGESEAEDEAEASEGPSEASAEEEVAVGELAQFSDEELKAELEKRGMKVASGGASITPLPEAGPEEGEEEQARKKSPVA